jgi:predicted lipid-binding transport protein (Tim44 family)
MTRSQRARKWVAIWAVLCVLGLLVIGYRWIAAGGNFQRTDRISVVSLLVTVLGLLVAWLSFVQQRKGSTAEALDDRARLDHAAETLAEAVGIYWNAEARTRSLLRPAPLRVRWKSTGRPVAARAATVVDSAVGGRPVRRRLRGRLDEVANTFMSLPHKRLVVLGEPGAGKTVLAILLTLDLLPLRPDGAVPVLLSVSSWDPTAHEGLRAWIARQLEEDYALRNAAAYGPAAAQRLVDAQRVLPILDGLDEIPAELRARALSELDRTYASQPLVVTCRSEEYEQAVTAGGGVLAAAAVVEIEPVTVGNAIGYLQAAIAETDDRWEVVFEHLRCHRDGALAKALSSPLMVALARTVYTALDRKPQTLVDMSAGSGDREVVERHREVIERHLLNSFIPAVYDKGQAAPAAPPSAAQRWDLASAHRYLSFLAAHLRQHSTRDLNWWEIRLALPKAIRRLLVPVATGVIGGVAGVILIGVADAVGFISTFGVRGEIAFGVVVGFIWGLMEGPDARPDAPARLHTRIRGRHGELAKELLWHGFVGGGLGGIVLGYLFETTAGVLVGVAVGVLIGLAVGALTALTRPADDARAVTAQSVLAADRSVTVARMIVLGVAAGVLCGVVVGIMGGVVVGIAAGVAAGVLVGAAFGIGFTAWGWFFTARLWLSIRDRLPWQLMAFLDDAHHREVLRQEGAAYQFRHALLQDHLVGTQGSQPDHSMYYGDNQMG